MPILLSIAQCDDSLYAAGPDGLFRVEIGNLAPIAQPMESLYCVAGVGDTLFTGGAPFGVAYLDAAGTWQGGWMDHAQSRILAIAPAPGAEHSGLLLAASAGDGLLRSVNYGRTWTLSNYGLREFTLLCVAWAPPPPPGRWPAREIVFCGGEHGIYRSPAAGLGWSHVTDLPSAVQTIAVSPDFHDDGLVLAGSEVGGLWRSTDAGRSFTQASGLPERIDSLLAISPGWLAATPDGIWFSPDSEVWAQVEGAPAALCLAEAVDGIFFGGEDGIGQLQSAALPHLTAHST